MATNTPRACMLIAATIARFSCMLGGVALLGAAPTATALASQSCQPSWSAFGLPAGGTVLALSQLEVNGTNTLYAGGGISGFMVRWNGAAWQPIANGPNAEVRALVPFDDGTGPALFAAGEFGTAGGVTLNGVGRFNGSTWSALSSGTGGFTLALFCTNEPSGPTIYAGGAFIVTPAGTVVNRIARWNGSAWTAMSTGMNGPVFAITRFDDGQGGEPAIYASGAFSTAGGTPAANIARWNGASWSAVGAGSAGGLQALQVFDDGTGPALYAAGLTPSVPPGAFVVRKWNGVAWTTVGASFNGNMSAFTVFDDGTGGGPALFVGGAFTMINSNPPQTTSGIAKLTPAGWMPISTSNGGGVLAFLPSPNGDAAMLVGGGFMNMGGIATKAIARWNTCTIPTPIAGDLNGDGIVNGADLALVLGSWGACQACVADIDESGVVDGADLAIVLGAWTG